MAAETLPRAMRIGLRESTAIDQVKALLQRPGESFPGWVGLALDAQPPAVLSDQKMGLHEISRVQLSLAEPSNDLVGPPSIPPIPLKKEARGELIEK